MLERILRKLGISLLDVLRVEVIGKALKLGRGERRDENMQDAGYEGRWGS
jgi:hypothetical protein